jgi:GNAT superfamily N-acetyltransferase
MKGVWDIMEAEIRRATLRDLPEVQRLDQMLFRKEASDYDSELNCEWPLQKGGEKYLRGMISKKDKCALVAVSGGRVVGYLTGSMVRKKLQDCYLVKMAEIIEMFVLKEFRGQDIGKKLVEEFRSWCRERGVGRILICAFSGNEKGIRFYKRNGFRDYSVYLIRDI